MQPDLGHRSDQAIDPQARLRNQLAFAEQLNVRFETNAVLAEAQLARLSDLLIDQAAHTASLQARLLRVAALCDLADWARKCVNPEAEADASVLVDELRRALL